MRAWRCMLPTTLPNSCCCFNESFLQDKEIKDLLAQSLKAKKKSKKRGKGGDGEAAIES